jgi:formylglycine-generating enzyme required for sulfatase activity
MRRVSIVLVLLALLWSIQAVAFAQPAGLSVQINPFNTDSGNQDLAIQIKKFIESAITFSGYEVFSDGMTETDENKISYVITGEISKYGDRYTIKYSINEDQQRNLYSQGQEELLTELIKIVSALNAYSQHEWADAGRMQHKLRRQEEIKALEGTIDVNAMVQIPAGEYFMGTIRGYDDERPPHLEEVAAFELDKYEVTVGSFVTFLNALGFNLEEASNMILIDRDALFMYQRGTWFVFEGFDLYPVYNVTWNGAQAFCGWNEGKRLPTEIEWEYAARANATTTYYWGDEWKTAESNNAEYGGSLDVYRIEVGRWDPAKPTPLPVGQFPANEFGLHDILGNIWEWTASFYSEYPDPGYWNETQNASYTYDENFRVLRGGSFATARKNQSVTVRLPSRSQAQSVHYGFRCARDIE